MQSITTQDHGAGRTRGSKQRRLVPVLGLLCLAGMACQGAQPPANQEATVPSSYPAHVVPCLDAMRDLPFAAGENLRGVSDSEGTCAISISFESQQDIDAFLEMRRAAGEEPTVVLHRLPDDSLQRIELLLRVGEGTRPP